MRTEATSETPAEPEVVIRRQGRLGHLILNRPEALNSLTQAMVETVRATLQEWRDDDGVQAVLVSGAGPKGLCAGGDVVSLYHAAIDGRPEVGEAFFAAEYAMNALIADFPKPYVAFMDGIVLGGGVGISAHGSHRIATERTRLGMPETGIGFIPDVGGASLLSRAVGYGVHMALTSNHITGADAVALGFADYYVPSAALDELMISLKTTEVSEAIAAVATEPPASPLAEHREWIESCYTQETAEQMIAALRAHGHPAAAEAAEQILAKSPTSVKATVELIRRARDMDTVLQVLEQDFRIAYHLLRGHDMPEGIRAQLVDKDRDPRWAPATLNNVIDADIDALFAPLGDGLELSDHLSATKETLS